MQDIIAQWRNAQEGGSWSSSGRFIMFEEDRVGMFYQVGDSRVYVVTDSAPPQLHNEFSPQDRIFRVGESIYLLGNLDDGVRIKLRHNDISVYPFSRPTQDA